MAIKLMWLDGEKRFEELCQALLAAEYSRFQAYSAPDWGMDGYDPETGTVYQAYFPEREPRRNKIRADLLKVKEHRNKCSRWVLMLPKNPTPGLLTWIKEEEQPLCPFPIDVWGSIRICALLGKHKAVRAQFFPTEVEEVIKRIAKGKKPAVGDAGPGQEVSPEQAAELREMIETLAEDAARRKKRKSVPRDFQAEYGEFNAYFKLSSYERLPREKLAEARKYLDAKLYARRGREPVRLRRNRMVAGIKAIEKALGMGDTRYRQVLFDLTGKHSTTEMEAEELERVFAHFRQLQGEEEATG